MIPHNTNTYATQVRVYPSVTTKWSHPYIYIYIHIDRKHITPEHTFLYKTYPNKHIHILTHTLRCPLTVQRKPPNHRTSFVSVADMSTHKRATTHNAPAFRAFLTIGYTCCTHFSSLSASTSRAHSHNSWNIYFFHTIPMAYLQPDFKAANLNVYIAMVGKKYRSS